MTFERRKLSSLPEVSGIAAEFKRYPKGPRIKEARNWRSVLRNIVDSRQKIEELKQIDILHEEKRAQ